MKWKIFLMNEKIYIEFLEYLAAQKMFSTAQLCQDLFVSYFTEEKKNGFFVEFGATDGITLSNTYIFEKYCNWTGVLAEPLPIWHNDLIKNRKCIIDKRCIFSESNLKKKFVNTYESPELSGLEDELKDYSSMRDFNVEARKKKEIIIVKTVSLEDLLKEYKAPKKIDYLSIDTEGSEYTILKNFNFKLYEISIITIEHNYIDDQRNNIKSLLEKNNFVRVFEKISRMDDWYINENNSVLKKLKLK